MIKIKLDGISWIETITINGRKYSKDKNGQVAQLDL